MGKVNCHRNAISRESDSTDDGELDETRDDVAVQERSPAPTPAPANLRSEQGESEWMRNPLGRDKSVRVLVTVKMGGKEIGKLIKLLEAQKAILDDEDGEDDPIYQ